MQFPFSTKLHISILMPYLRSQNDLPQFHFKILKSLSHMGAQRLHLEAIYSLHLMWTICFKTYFFYKHIQSISFIFKDLLQKADSIQHTGLTIMKSGRRVDFQTKRKSNLSVYDFSILSSLSIAMWLFNFCYAIQRNEQ